MRCGTFQPIYWDLCDVQYLWNIVPSPYIVSLGWGKCTRYNRYDKLAQDFLADFLIRFMGMFQQTIVKAMTGPRSNSFFCRSCSFFMSSFPWGSSGPGIIPKQQLPKSLPKNETSTSKKTTTPMFERKARSNTSSDCFFSEVYSQWFSQRGCRVSFLGGTLQPGANPTHGERVGALGRGRNLLPWVIYK